MQDLEITWPDGVARFSADDSPVHLGRSSGAAVPLTEGSISRRHLELLWDGTNWTAHDSSTHGTFDPIGVRLAPRWTLSSDTTIRLGGVEGVPVQIRPLPADSDPPSGNGSGRTVGGAIDGLTGPGSEGGNGSAPGGPIGSIEPGPAPLDDAPEPSFGGLFDPVEYRSEARGPDRDLSSGPLFPAGAPSRTTPSILGSALSSQSPDASPVPGSAGRPAPVLESESFDSPAPSPRSDLPQQTGHRITGAAADRSSDRSPRAGAGLSGVLEKVGQEPSAPRGPGPTGVHSAVDPNSTIISDSTLRINVGGQDYSFLPGAEVTIGRDPSCLVQLDERHSLVSRRHLRITFDDGYWWLEDFSSKGTFVNNRPLKKPYRAEGAFIVNLGDDDAGTPMRVITAGEHRVPRNKNLPAILGLAAAALIPLLILGLLLTRNGSSSSEPDFAAAKKSTVMLFGVTGGQGSGFMVADDLILTNQHVAVLSPQMLVGVSRQADEPAQIEYATELVANHPFLDLAVLRISNKATMTEAGPEILPDPVGKIGLPAVTVGDSTDVTIGDRVFNTGFPGRLSITSANDAGAIRLPSVVATSGEAANFAIWPGCSNPDLGLFIPADSPPGVACSAGGDLKNGVLLSSFFSSGQGASGSAVFHDNEVVAVVYAGAAEEDNATLSITSLVFADWLQEIIDQNK